MLLSFCFLLLFMVSSPIVLYWTLLMRIGGGFVIYIVEVGTALAPRIHMTVLKGGQEILRANCPGPSTWLFGCLFYFCLF